MHWNNIGRQDATGPKIELFLLVLAVILFGQLLIIFAKRRRKRNNALKLNGLLVFEYGYLAVVLSVLIVLGTTLANNLRLNKNTQTKF
ncbi:hypothetical protein IV38_GL000905 [Lactobacillus selangorensis]|uniref:Uncharacterized protein n=1 Tax=Lactobacillus selangorensis TaxID=81857 RepID=A0A0R2FV22_9LACO|nr:hypothetical protein IV38_GL000905 [Lactobacillus selangorensis]KRN32889.1 hypothetical protein IV40_GL000949 [Lactobacillus selangorensis]